MLTAISVLTPVTAAMFDRAAAALLARKFNVEIFDTAAAARAFILPKLTGSVGFGGSVTARDMGLYDALTAKNIPAYWHWMSPESRPEVYINALKAHNFVCSVNALDTDGVLYQIDGNGNRVAACAFSLGTLWLIIGANKIVEPARAIERIKRISCPQNARRLNLNTPCAHDIPCDLSKGCASPQRMCKSELRLTAPPSGRETRVLLIKESLGY